MAPNRRVLIVLPERVHLMDVVGPAQVFTSAAEAGAGYALSYVAERSGTETHQGLGLTAPTSWPALGEGDLVIVPGWRAQAGGRFSTSCRPVCSTGFVGIGNAAVISPPCAPSLRARRGRPPGGAHGHYPSRPDRGVGAGCRGIRVPGDVLFTCEERGHTSAGIASGTDLALHIVISSLMTMGRHWQPEWPAASSCPSQGPGRPRSGRSCSPTAATWMNSSTALRTFSTTPTGCPGHWMRSLATSGRAEEPCPGASPRRPD